MSDRRGLPRPFSYFGSKHAIASHYPAPKYPLVIEPFAGSAGYSCYWTPKRVELYDVDVDVVAAWKYLITASPSDVLRLPEDHTLVPDAAKSLVGYWLANGRSTPATVPSSWMKSGERPNAYWGPEARFRLTHVATMVKDWSINLISWDKIPVPNAPCTWFIDPPYHVSGKFYRHSKIVYDDLAAWCKTLPGQVIVCEQGGATWLPFSTLGSFDGSRGRTHEVVWSNC